MMKRMQDILWKLLQTALPIAGVFGTAVLFAQASAALRDKYGSDMHGLLSLLTLLVCLPAIYALLHAGRTLFGLLSGYRLAECSLLGLGLHRSAEGRLYFGRRRPVRRLCMLLTPPAHDGSSPYRLYTSGGVLLMGAVGIALICTGFWQGAVPELFYTTLAGVFLLLYSLSLLLPAKGSLSDTLRRLGSSVHLRRAREHRMHVISLNRRGLSMDDMPEDFFLPYPEELWRDPVVLNAQSNITFRSVAPGQYAQAHEQLTKLLALVDQPDFRMPQKEISRMYISCMTAIAEMMSGAAPAEANRLYDPSIELFLGGRWQGQLLLARYLRELLITHDRAQAQALLNQLQNWYNALPEKSRRSAWRIISDAQALASGDTLQEEDSHEQQTE